MPSYTEYEPEPVNVNPAQVTWTVGGVAHDRLRAVYMGDGEPRVHCDAACCCKRVAA